MISLQNIRTDTKILFGSLVAIAILSVITVLNSPAPAAPALSIRNDRADGAMALQRWLQRAGYEVEEVLSLSKQLAEVDVLFILEPDELYSDAQVQLINEWVRKGNTLIVCGSPGILNALLEPYELSIQYRILQAESASSAAPTLLHPTFDAAAITFGYPISSTRPEAVPHLFIDNHPVLMSLRTQLGQVWAAGIPFSFTNRGIRDEGNAKLIANLLANIPANAVIGFDEASHGYGDETALDFNGWLFGTAPGWGVLLAVAITVVYLALRGRHFGQIIPLPDDRLRRESGEYIQAMAALFRRSGERAEMLKHYESQLRRQLSKRYALDPKLENSELVKTVIYQDPSINEADLRDLLTRLRQTRLSEAELVRTVADVDLFLKQLQ